MITLALRSVSLTGLLLWAGIATAQSMSAPAAHTVRRDVPADAATHAATDVAMADVLRDGAHMRLTPTRVATAEDSLRADSIVFVLRDAIAKYRDVRVAEARGFRIFAPGVPQRVYHFTSWENAVRAELTFDATGNNRNISVPSPVSGSLLAFSNIDAAAG